MTPVVTAEELKSFVAKQGDVSPAAKHAFISMSDKRLNEMLGYHLGLVTTFKPKENGMWTLAHLCRPSNIISRHDVETYEWYIVDELIPIGVIITEDINYANGERDINEFKILDQNITMSEMNKEFLKEIEFYREKWGGLPAGVIISLASLEVPKNLVDNVGIEGGKEMLMKWINRGNTEIDDMPMIRSISI